MAEKKKIKIDRSQLSTHSLTGGGMGAPPKKSAPVGLFLFLVVVVLLGLGAVWMYLQKQQQDRLVLQRRAAAERIYNEAKVWEKAHPGEFDESIRRFEEVKAKIAGTSYTEIADLDIQRLRSAKSQAAGKVVRQLKRDAGLLAKARRFDEAIALLTTYQGPWAKQTKKEREAAADTLREIASRHAAQLAEAEKTKEQSDIQREKEAEKIRSSYPGEVDAIAEAYRTQADAVEQEISEQVDKLYRSYERKLAQLKTTFQSKGQLEPLLAVKKETERFAAEKAFIMDVPEDVDPAIQSLMKTYAVEAMSLDDDLVRKLGFVQKGIAVKLDGVVRQLTLKDQIDDALAVRELIEYVKAGQDLGEVIRNAGVKLEGGRGDWISQDATYAATSRMTTRSYYKRNVMFRGERLAGDGDYAFHSLGPGPHWLVIDLRRKALLGGLLIENLGGKGMADAATLTVWVSHDKKNWKEVWRAKKPERTWDILLRPTSCRFIKIGLREDAAFHLQAVKVFGRK